MPRESGASSIPEASESKPICPGVLDRPLSRAMTEPTNSVMVPRHDKSAFLHQRPRRLHSHPGRERAVGSQFAARPRHHRPARLRDRAAPRLRRLRAGAADGRHVSPAEHSAPIEVTTQTGPRRVAHQGGRSRVFQRRHQHGARLLPVAAQDRKRAGQRLVAAELGRACACRHSRADRSAARHERQMDHASDRRRDGLARSAAAVDERSARTRRGRADDAVRPCRDRRGFRQPLRQCRRPGPRLHQQRRHAVSAPPAGDAMDRFRGGEPPRHRRRRDRRVLALRRTGPDRHVHGRALAQRKPMAKPPPP